MIRPFIEIWFIIIRLVDNTYTPSFFFCSCNNNSSPINRMPIPLYYPTFDKSKHQLIVGYMPNPINLPIQGFNLLPCIWWKEWIGGLKSVDIAKDGNNVYCSDMFVSQIMFGIQTHNQKFPPFLKNLSLEVCNQPKPTWDILYQYLTLASSPSLLSPY